MKHLTASIRAPRVRRPLDHRRGGWAIAVAVAVAAIATLAGALAAAPRAARAEPSAPAPVEIVDVVHDPSGPVTVTIASSDPAFDPSRMTGFVDGLPVGVRVTEIHRRPPASLLLAIDTSGSMAGSPLLAAQEAARRLLDRLPPDDRVALVSFAAWPLVLSDFTTNRDITRNGLAVLAAVGETSLYDTVGLATNLLADQSADAPRVLVLLSDGRDSGFGAPDRAATTIDAIAASGVEVHAFGLGEDVDTDYLTQLADVGGGAYYAIADEASLGALFAALGTRLGDRYVVELPSPPLTTGEHVIALRTGAADPGITAPFTVTNDGLFDAQLADPSSPESDAPLVIEVGTGDANSVLRFEASIAGVPLPVVNGRIYIDPWLVSPGHTLVEVHALIGGTVAASREVAIEVPALEPEITTTLDDHHLEVSARVQAASSPLITVRDARTPGAAPLAQATGDQLVTDLPPSVGPLAIEVRRAGDVVARRSLEAPVEPVAAASAPPAFAIPAAAALLLVLVATLLVLRLRRGRQRSAIRVRARRLGMHEPGTPPPPSDLGSVVVRAPDGAERCFTVGPRPLTIGRSPSCDIVLPDPSIRPVHSRISGRQRGEFHVHGLRPATRADRSPIDDWTVLHAGESIMVGEHVITVLDRVGEAGLAS